VVFSICSENHEKNHNKSLNPVKIITSTSTSASLTTGVGLRSREHSKHHIRSLYAPIIIPGSLDNLSGLQIPDQPVNGQLQELAHKTRELLIDGNVNSLRYTWCSKYPCRGRRTKAGARKSTSGVQCSIKRIPDGRGFQLFSPMG